MGILGLFKKKEYKFQNLYFSSSDEDAISMIKHSNEVEIYSSDNFIYCAAIIDVKKACHVYGYLKIYNPDGKEIQNVKYHQDLSGASSGSKECIKLTAIGKEDTFLFERSGKYTVEVYDDDDNFLIEGSFNVKAEQDLYEKQGYIRVDSVEIANCDKDGNCIEPFRILEKAGLNSDMEYLRVKLNYSGLGQKTVVYTAFHFRLSGPYSDPKTNGIRMIGNIVLEPDGGTLLLWGPGNSNGNCYQAGEYHLEIKVPGADKPLVDKYFSISQSSADAKLEQKRQIEAENKRRQEIEKRKEEGVVIDIVNFTVHGSQDSALSYINNTTYTCTLEHKEEELEKRVQNGKPLATGIPAKEFSKLTQANLIKTFVYGNGMRSSLLELVFVIKFIYYETKGINVYLRYEDEQGRIIKGKSLPGLNFTFTESYYIKPEEFFVSKIFKYDFDYWNSAFAGQYNSKNAPTRKRTASLWIYYGGEYKCIAKREFYVQA